MPASSALEAKVSVFMSDSLLFTCTISVNPFVCALFPSVPGPNPKLSAEQQAELAKLVEMARIRSVMGGAQAARGFA